MRRDLRHHARLPRPVRARPCHGDAPVGAAGPVRGLDHRLCGRAAGGASLDLESPPSRPGGAAHRPSLPQHGRPTPRHHRDRARVRHEPERRRAGPVAGALRGGDRAGGGAVDAVRLPPGGAACPASALGCDRRRAGRGGARGGGMGAGRGGQCLGAAARALEDRRAVHVHAGREAAAGAGRADRRADAARGGPRRRHAVEAGRCDRHGRQAAAADGGAGGRRLRVHAAGPARRHDHVAGRRGCPGPDEDRADAPPGDRDGRRHGEAAGVPEAR